MASSGQLRGFPAPVVAVFLWIGVSSAEEAWTPPAMPESDYEEFWEMNPFNRKTVVQETPAGPSFAADLSLAGISVIGEKQRVLLVNRKTKGYQSVTNEEAGDGEIRLIRINSNPDRSKVTAVIAKDGKEAEVKFDSKLIKNIADRQRSESEAKAKRDAALAAARDRGMARAQENAGETPGQPPAKGMPKGSRIKLPGDVIRQPESEREPEPEPETN